MNSGGNLNNLIKNQPPARLVGGRLVNRGRLKNGNPSGDYMKAPRCGAKNRQGMPCHAPAMRGKARCRLHGGRSTGERTLAGIHRIRKTHWKDGRRSTRLQQEFRAWADQENQRRQSQFELETEAQAIVRKEFRSWKSALQELRSPQP